MSNPNDSTLTKRCTKCGKEYPATTDYFTPNKGGKYGLRPDCKQCHSAQTVAQQKKKAKRPASSTEPLGIGVYIIHYIEIPMYYKIGFSSVEARKRIVALSGVPFDPQLSWFVPCSNGIVAGWLEQALHDRLSVYRIKRTEWFRLFDTHIDILKRLKRCGIDFTSQSCFDDLKQFVDEALGTFSLPLNIKHPWTALKFEMEVLDRLNTRTENGQWISPDRKSGLSHFALDKLCDWMLAEFREVEEPHDDYHDNCRYRITSKGQAFLARYKGENNV